MVEARERLRRSSASHRGARRRRRGRRRRSRCRSTCEGPTWRELQRISDQIAAADGDDSRAWWTSRVFPGRAAAGVPHRGEPRPGQRAGAGHRPDRHRPCGRCWPGRPRPRWEDPTGEERDVVVQVAPGQRTSLENLTLAARSRPRAATTAAAPSPCRSGQIAQHRARQRALADRPPGPGARRHRRRRHRAGALHLRGLLAHPGRARRAGPAPPATRVSLGGETEQLRRPSATWWRPSCSRSS